MIRIIAEETDAGRAANIGGPVKTIYRTFDVELPVIEAWLMEPERKEWSYIDRAIVGIEIRQPPGETP